MQTSREAYEWLRLNRSEVQTARREAQRVARESTDTEALYAAKEVIKSTHSIHSRNFEYVELGVVKHGEGKEVEGGTGSAGCFRFVDSDNGFVRMALLSCFCSVCFAGKYSECKEPHSRHSELKLVKCVAVKGRGVALSKQEAQQFLNTRAKKLVADLKPGDDVFVWIDPQDGHAHKFEPMRVVEWEEKNGQGTGKGKGKSKAKEGEGNGEGGSKHLVQVGPYEYINLAPFIPKSYDDETCTEWVWNSEELCDKQYSACYTPEHLGFDEKSERVWTGREIGKGESVPVCRKQHVDPKPITALRPPVDIQLTPMDGPRRGAGRRAKKGSGAGAGSSQYQRYEVSPGLRQKALQVLMEEAAAYESAWFVFRQKK
jgi:hypothetical protein